MSSHVRRRPCDTAQSPVCRSPISWPSSLSSGHEAARTNRKWGQAVHGGPLVTPMIPLTSACCVLRTQGYTVQPREQRGALLIRVSRGCRPGWQVGVLQSCKCSLSPPSWAESEAARPQTWLALWFLKVSSHLQVSSPGEEGCVPDPSAHPSPHR